MGLGGEGEGVPKNKDKRISYRMFDGLLGLHRVDFKQMVGRALTIVDGFASDPVQRKAIKNMMEDTLYRFDQEQSSNIRRFTRWLAEALKEECDWVYEDSAVKKKYNPLMD